MDKLVKKDVIRRYKQMLKTVSKENYYKDRTNCYVCEKCGAVTKTIDIDNGVTPMGIECPYCHENAMSSFYQDIAPNIEITHEWYRPTLDETLQLASENKIFTVTHILNGGLIRRPCSKN